MTEIRLSIIIPCYNEAKNIPLVLEKAKKIFSNIKKEENFELILVDNNSNDNTNTVLKKLLQKKEYGFARSVFQPSPGYGAAIIKGIGSAKGEFLCWTHADLQTDIGDCFRALKIIKEQKDQEKVFVKGRRYGRSPTSNFFSYGMALFETLYLKTLLYEINAQPNLLHKNFLNLMKNPPEDFSFDLYVYYLAKKKNFKITRFPVFFGKRVHGHSTWDFGFKSKLKLIKRTVKFTIELKKRLN